MLDFVVGRLAREESLSLVKRRSLGVVDFLLLAQMNVILFVHLLNFGHVQFHLLKVPLLLGLLLMLRSLLQNPLI